MLRIKGIVFDWAGTTVDFGCFAPVNAFLEVFNEAGIEVTIEEARHPMGMLKKDHIRSMLSMPRIFDLWRIKYGRAYCEQDVECLYNQFEPMLLASLNKYVNPIEGVTEIVGQLRSNGLKIGSTTGYTSKMMIIVTEGARELGYEPDFLVTPDDTGNSGRPYPFMLYRNMEAMKVMTPIEVVKVGDTISDIQEGVNAGAWSVGVAVGSSTMGLSKEEYHMLSKEQRHQYIKNAEQVYKEAGAHFVIETVSDLPQLIEKINGLLDEGKRPDVI